MGVGSRWTTLAVTLVALLAASATVDAQSIEGDVRLTERQANSALNGLVQVYHEGAWLPVCLKPWQDNLNIATVVCKQLGFFGGAVSTYRANGPSSPGGSWLDGVSCTGQEISLAECEDLTYGSSDCTQGEHAGLRCAHPTYEGCFHSTSSVGPLTAHQSIIGTMDVAHCRDSCLDRGLEYAGLQGGIKCSCGDSYSGAQSQPNTACNEPCGGDADEICGGMSTLSIYRTASSHREVAEGGYVTSAGFPSPYVAGDEATYQILIPDGYDHVQVVYAHFDLAAGDRVVLSMPGATHSPGDGVPEPWVSTVGAAGFAVNFTVAAGSAGSAGFALEYTFGKVCDKTALPSSITDGGYTASENEYRSGEHVVVDCEGGYRGDRVGFVCQRDGSWSETPVCEVLPTDPPPTTTVAPETTTTPPTTAALSEAPTTAEEEEEESTTGQSVDASSASPQSTSEKVSLPDVPCPVPEVAGGSVDSGSRASVDVGDMVTLTCQDSYEPVGGNTNATCLFGGEFDVGLLCDPEYTFPVWLLVIIVVAVVLAIIVIVLVILLLIIHNEDKHRARRRPRQPPSYRSEEMQSDPQDERLVAIPPSALLGHSAVNSVTMDSEPEERQSREGEDASGAVNQAAQTDADPSLGELGDPSVGDAGESDVYHPTRDYPGAGRGAPPPPPPPPAAGNPLSQPPPLGLGRQHSVDYHRGGPADFSMLPSEEMLALRALDNVVSDFERGDQGYYLGPSGPSPYNMDRASHYGSRQVQFSQRSRLSSFYGLY